MKLGAGYPMGPIELMDYVGLDTSKFIMDGKTRAVCTLLQYKVVSEPLPLSSWPIPLQNQSIHTAHSRQHTFCPLPKFVFVAFFIE